MQASKRNITKRRRWRLCDRRLCRRRLHLKDQTASGNIEAICGVDFGEWLLLRNRRARRNRNWTFNGVLRCTSTSQHHQRLPLRSMDAKAMRFACLDVDRLGQAQDFHALEATASNQPPLWRAGFQTLERLGATSV